MQVGGAGDGRPAHAACHQRRVRCLAPLGGEDAPGCLESGNVLGLGERPHEDHGGALRAGRHGVFGGEHDRSLGGSRRGGHPSRQHLVAGVRVEGRVQQRVERACVDRRDRLRLGQQALLDSVHGKAHRGLGRTLGAAGLEHVEPALLHGELRVLHVLEVALEQTQGVHEL